MTTKLQSKDIAIVALIAVSGGRDPAEAVAPLVADHKDPSALLTKAIALLEEQGVPSAKLFTLSELRSKFKKAKVSSAGRGAKGLAFGDTKKFKVQVVAGRAFVRVPVDIFDAGQQAVSLSNEDISASEKRSRTPSLCVTLLRDEDGRPQIVVE